MHSLMVDEIVNSCRQREKDGDCAGPCKWSKEQLEDCIIQLAHSFETCRNDTIELVANAAKIFAPDLMQEFSERWQRQQNQNMNDLEALLKALGPA